MYDMVVHDTRVLAYVLHREASRKKRNSRDQEKGKEDATMTSVSLRENPEETRSNAKSKALFECVLICNACRNTQKPRRPRT